MYNFYKILVPDAHDGPTWAQRMGNTYGFDFDLHQSSNDVVLAWPMDDHLEERLTSDGIEYSKFQVRDLTAFFNL